MEPTPAEKSPPQVAIALALAAGAVAMLIGGFSEEALVAALGLVAILFLLPWSNWLLVVFLAALLGLCVPTSEHPIPVGPIKLYGADGILYFMGVAFVSMLGRYFRPAAVSEPRPKGETFLLVLLVATFCYGLLSLALGLSSGFTPNDALGAFRRLNFYALALAVPLFMPLRRTHIDKLRYALWCGCVLVILTGAYRLATGQTWSQDYFSASMAWTAQERLLSQFEIATLGMGLGYLLANLRADIGRFERLCSLGLATMCIAFLLLSGWRLALIYLALAPAISLVLMMWLGKHPFQGLLKTFFILGVVALLCGIGLALVAPEFTAETLETMKQRTIERRIDEDLRYHAWQHILGLVRKAPWLGTGLGLQLEFYLKASDGQFLWTHATAHSLYFEVLGQCGIIGLVLFVLFHASFVIYTVTRLPRVRAEYHPLLTGLLAGYLCAMAINALQPLQTGSLVALYLIMGFVVLMMRPSAPDPQGGRPLPINRTAKGGG